MSRALKALGVVCLVAAGIPAMSAEDSEHHHPLGPRRPMTVPGVSYSIQAHIVPESSLVRAKLEIEYRNLSQDSLGEVHFDIGLPAYFVYRIPGRRSSVDDEAALEIARADDLGYCRIDSVLYHGAPLVAADVIIEATSIRAVLPFRLAPGERAFFLMTFESRMPAGHSFNETSDYVQFIRWFPRARVYRDGQWFDSQACESLDDVGEYAHFRVELTVDSAYSLVHPGELVNDKEHYGLLPGPDNDTVYVDIVNQHQLEYNGMTYEPTFRSGLKRFLIWAHNTGDFSFVVKKGLIRDRSYVDSLTIEACYTEDVQAIWGGFVAKCGAELVRQYEQWLGGFPYRFLRIVAGGTPREYQTSGQLIILPDSVTDQSLLYTMLAVRIANCWFSPVLPVSESAARHLDEGLAYYAAIMALSDKRGSYSYRMIGEYEEYLHRLGAFSSGSDSSGTDSSGTDPSGSDRKKWADAAGSGEARPAAGSTRDMSAAAFLSALELITHRVPARLYMLRFCLGDDGLWASLGEYARRFRYRIPGEYEFRNTVADVTPDIPEGCLILAELTDDNLDYSVGQVDIRQMRHEYEISYVLENHGSLVLPVEIGFVMAANDTLYDTAQCEQFAEGDTRYVITTLAPDKPRAVVLDPNHYLLDANRRNNYHFEGSAPFRYDPPARLFPPFRDIP